jgi:glutathione S-transferase
MKLHYHPASTTSRIVELFVRDQGIDLEYQLVDLFIGAHKHPDFEKLNPDRLVPVLEDGDFFLTESSAIVKYIAKNVDPQPIQKTCRRVHRSTR